MVVPTMTIDLITQLKRDYPDKLETDPAYVGTPAYWQKVGVVELVRALESASRNLALKDKKA